MAQDDKKTKRPRSPSLGGDAPKVDVRTTAMGLPSTSQHFVDEEGWQMVPLSDLDPLPEFPATHTPSSTPHSQAGYEYEGESTDVKNVLRGIPASANVKKQNFNVQLSPIELAPVRQQPVRQNRDLVAKDTVDKLSQVRVAPQDFVAGRTDVGDSEVGEDVAKVRVVAGPNIGEERFINGPVMTIGRALDNTFMTLDLAMSRKHFLIQRGEQNAYWVRDNGSANGTFVNGVQLTEPVMLIPGDRIEAGESLLEFIDTWRPLHDTRGRFGNTVRPSNTAAAPVSEVPTTTPKFQTAAPKKKFALAWLFAVLSLVVAVGALVFALVARPPSNQNPVESAYVAATEAKRSQDWETARNHLLEVKRLDPSFEKIDDELAEIERELQSSRALETAQALIKRESYETAIGELAQVPKESVYYAQARTLLSDAKKQFDAQPVFDDNDGDEDKPEVAAKTETDDSDDDSGDTIALEFEEDDKVVDEEEDGDDTLDLDLGDSKEPETKKPVKKVTKPKPIKRITKKKKKPKKKVVEEDDGFDLDLGSSSSKKKSTSSKKKKKTKPKKKSEEDENLSIW